MHWISFSNPPEVAPVNDLRQHVHGCGCWCQPFVDEHGTIVHNSADGREAYERGERKPH